MDREKIKKRLFIWHLILWIFLFIAIYRGYAVYFVDLSSTKSKWVALFAGSIALLLAAVKICESLYCNHKDLLVDKVVKYFYNGLMIFHKRNVKILLFITLVLTWFLYKPMGMAFTLCFIVGVLTSLFVFYSGIFIFPRISVRVLKAFENSSNSIFSLIFNSGIVVSMTVVGFCLCSLAILFHIYKDYQILTGFLLGVSIPALLNCTSSAIVKKSTFCASGFISGFVGEIDSYDKRSPILLLKGVSKSIFNIVSLSSDMLLTFAISIIASMTLGAWAYNLMGCFLPLIIASGAVFSSVFVILLTKMNKTKNPVGVLFSSVIKTIILFLAISFYCIKIWMPDTLGLFYSIALGAFGGFVFCFVSSNYIFEKFKPVKNVANSAIGGYLPSFLQTIREGFMSVFIPVFLFSLIFIFGFILSDGIQSPLFGLYGVSISILAMISIIGIMISVNSFGLVLNSSNEFVRTYENNEDINLTKQNISYLSNISHCIIALSKNYFNISAILCSVVAVVAATLTGEVQELDILNPYVLFSLFIGSSVPFLYIAFVLSGVSKSSKRLVLEVKRQLRNFPQILRFEMRPDYEKCIDVISKNSIIQSLFYVFLVAVLFFAVGFSIKTEAACAFVIGVILSSCGLIFFSNNSSFVVKSAKKYLRNEYINSNRSDEYTALVQNNEVFASLKDLITPSLVGLIKFLAVLLMAFIPLFMQ